MSMSADTRLYAGAIALASGIYSVGSAIAGGMGMVPISDSVMLVVGIVVIAHGIVLLTALAERLGRASGPLMIVWAATMLANQLLATTMSSSMMVSWDAGMVALAVLMLASGLIMSRRPGRM
jgi:hypothetical protein